MKKYTKNENLNMGFVGAGWIIENAHLISYQRLGVKLGAIFDLDLERVKKVAEKFSIGYACDDIEQFWNSGVNAIVIATPNFTHFQYAKEALLQGIHVLCEKPITIKMQEVEELCKIAEENGVIFLPGFVIRFRSDIKKTYELLENDEIGTVESVEAGWIRKNGVPRIGSWFTSKRLSGGGTLIDIGTHVLDIALSFVNQNETDFKCWMESKPLNFELSQECDASWFGKKKEEEYATQVDVEEFAKVGIDYSNGKSIQVTTAWKSGLDGDCTYYNIHGSKGTIKLRTLFGFSNEFMYENRYCQLTNDKGEQIFYFKDKEIQRDAFFELSKYFIERITGNEDGYLSSNDASNVVGMIENMYQNEKEIEIEVEEYLHANRELYSDLC